MNKKIVKSFLIFLVLVQTAYADESNISPEELFKQFDSAANQAKDRADLEFPMEEDLKSLAKTKPVASPTPDNRNTDQIIDDLMKEVESLQSEVVVTKKTSLSTQRPSESKVLGSRTIYSFKDGDVYEIHAGVDRITDIELQPGESLTSTPVSGDVVRWKISVLKSYTDNKDITHIVLKPIDTGIETNILLTTDRRTYHLRAIAGDWYMPSVSWNYPQDDELEEQMKALDAEKYEGISVTPEELNFNYEIDGDDYPWTPLRVFDDGSKTYFQVSKESRNRESPALFVIDEDDVILVNYRVKGDYYIIDRVVDHAQLRIGTKKIVDVWAKGTKPSFFKRIF